MKLNSYSTRLSALVLVLALLVSLLQSAPVVHTDRIQPVKSPFEAPITVQSTQVDPQLRPGYDAGNCRQLKGAPFVMVIYLDDDVSNWTEEEVLTYNETLIEPALSYMEENAAKWGVYLDLNYGYYATYGHPDRPVKYNGTVENFNDGKTSDDILDQAALSLGFESKEAMHDRLREFSGSTQIAYLIMMDKGGRSYSCNYSQDNPWKDHEYALEFSLIFSGFTDTSRDSASDTVVHETLHLFGAEDYYYPDSRKALAEKYYPEDIMLCAMSDLAYFTLEEYTAFTLGWTNQIPEVCTLPGWWGE